MILLAFCFVSSAFCVTKNFFVTNSANPCSVPIPNPPYVGKNPYTVAMNTCSLYANVTNTMYYIKVNKCNSTHIDYSSCMTSNCAAIGCEVYVEPVGKCLDDTSAGNSYIVACDPSSAAKSSASTTAVALFAVSAVAMLSML
jgi:hypothetical protein